MTCTRCHQEIDEGKGFWVFVSTEGTNERHCLECHRLNVRLLRRGGLPFVEFGDVEFSDDSQDE